MSETAETHFMGQRLVSSPPNTLFPNQPGYQRPDPHPDDIYQPTPVTARAITVDGTVVEQGQAVMEHANTAYAKFLNDIPREHYSTDGLKAQIAKFAETDAAKAVDTAVDSFRGLEEATGKQVDKIRRDLSPNGDVAAELRATRVWDRTRPLLDNAKEGALGRAQKLIANANREELGTLLQELPAYLEALGHPTDWIDAAVGQAVPEYDTAIKRHQTAKQAHTIAKYNALSLRKSFAEGRSGSVITDARKYNPDR
jgi:chromosome segregation ATPase